MLGAAARESQTRGAQRRPRVVGHLARPHEVPQRLAQRLGRDIELGEQVGEEAGPGGQARAQELVLGGLADERARAVAGERGAIHPRAALNTRRRPDQGRVLAEVQRHAAGASERARTDPHELPARAQAVQPRLRVGAGAPRQHVALPDLDREREPLQRHEHLAQAVDPGARGGVTVDPLPRGQEGRQAARLGGLDLLAQRRQRGAPQTAQNLDIAPLAPARRRGEARRGRAGPARSSSRSTALASTP